LSCFEFTTRVGLPNTEQAIKWMHAVRGGTQVKNFTAELISTMQIRSVFSHAQQAIQIFAPLESLAFLSHHVAMLHLRQPQHPGLMFR
jgi:hypothetical protein